MPAAAIDAVAYQPHRISKPVVRSSGAVFSGGAAKFAHHHDHIARLCEVLTQLRQSARQVAEVVGQCAVGVALTGMGVPAASRQKAQSQRSVIAHQGAQVLRIQLQTHRVCRAIAGREHLGILCNRRRGRTVFVEATLRWW